MLADAGQDQASDSDPHYGELLDRPVNHSFCYGIIRTVFTLVISNAVSFRAASATLHSIQWLFPPELRGACPAASTGQNWILRIGLHELNRLKEIADDWALIMDHTIQLGKIKVLVVVGCRLSHWRSLERPLQLQDLVVFAIEPVEQSNGPIVLAQLEKIRQRFGIIPRLIVSDHGSDLKLGIELFQQKHPEVKATYDIAHMLAILIKRYLERDDSWVEYSQQCAQTKLSVQQTELAYVRPPTPKTKARYMNVEPQARWGLKALAYLDRMTSQQMDEPDVPQQEFLPAALLGLEEFELELDFELEPGDIDDELFDLEHLHGCLTGDCSEEDSNEKTLRDKVLEEAIQELLDTEVLELPADDLDPKSNSEDASDMDEEWPERVSMEQLEAKLGWLRDFRPKLQEWCCLINIICCTLKYVRTHGYHASARQELSVLLSKHRRYESSGSMIDEIATFVDSQSSQAAEGEHLLGSSECIESLIGKGKRLEGQQSKGGFTKMILALAATVVTPTKDRIFAALSSVTTKDLRNWCNEKLGKSLSSRRRAALQSPDDGTKTG